MQRWIDGWREGAGKRDSSCTWMTVRGLSEWYHRGNPKRLRQADLVLQDSEHRVFTTLAPASTHTHTHARTHTRTHTHTHTHTHERHTHTHAPHTHTHTHTRHTHTHTHTHS